MNAAAAFARLGGRVLSAMKVSMVCLRGGTSPSAVTLQIGRK